MSTLCLYPDGRVSTLINTDGTDLFYLCHHDAAQLTVPVLILYFITDETLSLVTVFNKLCHNTRDNTLLIYIVQDRKETDNTPVTQAVDEHSILANTHTREL
jgi:hypothetical protein